MSDALLADAHEPEDILTLIAQSVPCVRESINEQGYADYMWQGVESKEQVERKLWSDILGDIDAVEDQLRRERQAHPDVRLKLLVEGVATSHVDGTVVWLPTKGDKKIMFPAKHFRLPLQAAYAWFYQVSKYIEVYITPDKASTAIALVAFYKADQKEEHTTFHRYLRNIDFHPNPQVEGMMNIMKGTSIGAVRAQALIAHFGTIWNVIGADVKEIAAVEGMGLKTAQQLLRKVGRPDV